MTTEKKQKREAGSSRLTHVLTEISRQLGVLEKTLSTVQPFHFAGMPDSVAQVCLEFLDCKELRLLQSGVSKKLQGKLADVHSWVIQGADRDRMDVKELFGPCDPNKLRHLIVNDDSRDIKAHVPFSPLITTLDVNMSFSTYGLYPLDFRLWTKLSRVFIRCHQWRAPTSDPLTSVLEWLDSLDPQKADVAAIGLIWGVPIKNPHSSRLADLCKRIEKIPTQRRPRHIEFGTMLTDLTPLLKLLPKLETLRLFASCQMPPIHPKTVDLIQQTHGKQLRDLQLIGYNMPQLPNLNGMEQLTTLLLHCARGSDQRYWYWDDVVACCGGLTKLQKLSVPTCFAPGDETKSTMWPELRLLDFCLSHDVYFPASQLAELASFLQAHPHFRHLSCSFSVETREDIQRLRSLLRSYTVDSVAFEHPTDLDNVAVELLDTLPSTVQHLVLDGFVMDRQTIRQLKRFANLRVLCIKGEFNGENLETDPKQQWLDDLPTMCPLLRRLEVDVLQTFPAADSAFVQSIGKTWFSLVSANIRDRVYDPPSNLVPMDFYRSVWNDMSNLWI